MHTDFDVIISGAGLVGASLACALLQSGLRVALVEARPASAAAESAEGYDPRVYALTRASERMFRNLGVWPGVESRRYSAFREMRVWDGHGHLHFDSADLAEPTLGYIVEQAVLLQAVHQRLQQQPRLTWLRPRRVEQFSLESGAVRVTLDDARSYRAALLAGADGAHSHLRQLAGIACDERDYGHHAVVASVRTERPHANTAWQHFLPAGPLAFLPLADPHTCSIVWSLPPRQAAQVQALATAEFHAELERAFESRLGAVQWSGPRALFPLRRRHAASYIGPRLALLGDAAHTIHPLAGQGVNLGLLDMASLSQVVSAAVAARRDPGGDLVLRRYQRWRRGDNQAMLWLMDGLKHLFASRLPGLPLLRHLGLNLTDATLPLKRALMRRAMGLDGDLPELARLRYNTAEPR